jgi:uncharacterized membrane protein
LWLIFLEFTIIRFSLVFNLDYSFFGIAQVIWVIGVSMIAMAAMIYLPVKVVGVVGVLMIVLHNLLGGFQVPIATAFGGAPPPDLSQMLCIILHQPGIVPLFNGVSVFSAYPLIPWMKRYKLSLPEPARNGPSRAARIRLSVVGRLRRRRRDSGRAASAVQMVRRT